MHSVRRWHLQRPDKRRFWMHWLCAGVLQDHHLDRALYRVRSWHLQRRACCERGHRLHRVHARDVQLTRWCWLLFGLHLVRTWRIQHRRRLCVLRVRGGDVHRYCWLVGLYQLRYGHLWQCGHGVNVLSVYRMCCGLLQQLHWRHSGLLRILLSGQLLKCQHGCGVMHVLPCRAVCDQNQILFL